MGFCRDIVATTDCLPGSILCNLATVSNFLKNVAEFTVHSLSVEVIAVAIRLLTQPSRHRGLVAADLINALWLFSSGCIPTSFPLKSSIIVPAQHLSFSFPLANLLVK